jgi:transposase
LAEVEIIARVEQRRRWTEEEKAALLDEVDAEGGKVAMVARRHRISESLLYNWRAARKAVAQGGLEPLAFMPLGVVGHAENGGPALLAAPPDALRPASRERPRADRVGMIEIDLLSGVRVRVDAFVNEKALRRVLEAVKGAM